MNYSPIIGLEVHVELKTASKMFCSCSADYFGKQPNTHTCPVCLGMPGALPVPNKKAVDWCVMIALALNCKINNFSKFDRKNYFYPDLAKGYQISQYDLPFGIEGHMVLKSGKKIRIRRVHMEEDTGKLIHDEVDGENVSLIDFNRSGVPLVEIVTEPDFENALEVKEYLQRLQQIVRYLDVSNADMEKGDMRLEPNISLSPHSPLLSGEGQGEVNPDFELPNYKVEVKNINSFKFVEKAINFELDRQKELLEKGEIPPQETRGWNENKQKTFSQRSKEEAHDYRYFPEPDIPPVTFTDNQINSLQERMPELPEVKVERFMKSYALPYYDTEILTRDVATANYYEEAVKIGNKQEVTPKQIANTIINKRVSIEKMTPAELVKSIKAASQTVQVDEAKLQAVITEVIAENQKAVEDYKKGKVTVIMFLVGQVMRKLAGKAEASVIRKKLEEMLKINI